MPDKDNSVQTPKQNIRFSKSIFLYLLCSSQNPREVEHHTASLASGLRGNVASEFGMEPCGYFCEYASSLPNCSGLVRFTTRTCCAVLCFVHISTSLTQVEFSFINTVDCKKHCVLPLVPESTLVANNNDRAPQSSRHICPLEILFPPGPQQPPRGQTEPQMKHDRDITLQVSDSQLEVPTLCSRDIWHCPERL